MDRNSGHQRPGRLVVVSNRLPVVLQQDSPGHWTMTAGAGGLIAALAPVLQQRGGLWIGWPGVVQEDLSDPRPILERGVATLGYAIEPVALTAAERTAFYNGFSNKIIWPLFHDFQGRCTFDPSYWQAYLAVNRTFAERVAACTVAADTIWVHDYHLMHVAVELRALQPQHSIGFFLHIPFPPADIFLKLPWRDQILAGLLAYNWLGFQTERDLRNFLQCCAIMRPDVQLSGAPDSLVLAMDERSVRVGAFPISVDAQSLASRVATPRVQRRIARIRQLFPDQTLFFGIDRLDYTKGIPERLLAFDHALQTYPELRERVTFIQVVVPSRADIAEYAAEKLEIDQLVGQINSTWTRLGWVPIHYVYRSIDDTRLLAYYQAAQIALVTPLKDGMNLVAKEYVVCAEERGVLILSEFAGAAAQLGGGALLVNPYDVDGMARALHAAWSMAPAERAARMARMKEEVAREDIFWWLRRCLDQSAEGHL